MKRALIAVSVIFIVIGMMVSIGYADNTNDINSAFRRVSGQMTKVLAGANVKYTKRGDSLVVKQYVVTGKDGAEVVAYEEGHDSNKIYAQIAIIEKQIADLKDPVKVQEQAAKQVAILEAKKVEYDTMKVTLEGK